MPRAVVLLSGGLDSATVLAVARRDGFEVTALSFAYGQRHAVELDAARRVAAAAGVTDHRWLSIDLRAIGGSALTADVPVPKGEGPVDSSVIPVTYVPARNTVFLALALGLAETLDAFDLFVGANALDYSGYPDCRPEFLSAFEALANVATKAGATGRGRYRIHAPLLHLTKAEIVRLGLGLGVDYGLTHSCYDPVLAGGVVRACGRCDSCRLRLAGFAEVGRPDPAPYAEGSPGIGSRPGLD